MLAQRTAEFNQAILDTVANLIIVIGRQGQIVRFNKACETTTGYRYEEVKDKIIWDLLLPPEEVSAVKTLFEQLWIGNFPNTFENCWLTRTGEHRLISWSNTALLGEDNQVEFVIATGIDVTELRKTETKAQQYPQMLEALVKNTTDAIFVKDLEGRFQLINQVCAAIVNRPIEEILGRTLRELWPEEAARQFEEQDQLVISTGLSHTSEITLLNSQNQLRTYLATRDPYRDTQGQIIGVMCVSRDITERKQIELALQESEARFFRLFQSAPLPIALTRLNDEVCLDVNLSFTRLTGLSREEAIGRTYLEAIRFPPEQRRRVLAQVEKKGFVRNFEVEIWSKNDQPLQVLLSSEVIELAGENCLLTALQDITERKNYERQLKKWADIFQNIHLAVVLTDATGQSIDMANQAAVQLLGYDRPEELVGQSPITFFKTDLLPRYLSLFQNVQNQDYFAAELGILRKDGTFFPAEISSTRVWDEAGQLLYRIITIRDITARHEAEEALKRSEELYRTLAENIPDASVILFDHDLRYLLAYGSALSQYGFLQEQTVGKTLWETASPEYVMALEPIYRAALAGTPTTFEQSYQGGIFYCQAIPVRNPQGEIFAGLLMIQEITALKQTEGALRESEELYRSLFDNSLYGVILGNPQGEIRAVNKAACQILGYEEEELRASGRDGILDQNDPRLPSYLEWRLKSNTVQTEINFVRKDGTLINCEIARSRYLDKNNQERSCIIFKDITEKQKLEQERLKVSKLESLGVLAGGIAHDFNNVLTSIIANLELASLQIDQSAEAQEYLGLALASTDRASGLAQKLLTFARGGKPLKIKLEPASFLKEMVQQIPGHEFQKEGKSLRINYELAEDLWSLSADKVQLTQVLTALLTNALQASSNGEEITIKAYNIELAGLADIAPGSYLKISVIDQGEGIPGHHLPRIFDPYFTTRGAHHGLGLALAYSIIKNHGGHIDALSELGKGSTFSIYLPTRPVEATPPVFQKKATSSVTTLSPLLNPDATKLLRVLVMDDDGNVRHILGKLLGHLNCQADLTDRGEEALERYQQAQAENKPYDLVILDLTIETGMGGKETLQKLLKIDSTVKAIVSSGYCDDNIISNYQDYGFKDVLPKPYTLAQLKNVVAKYFFSPR